MDATLGFLQRRKYIGRLVPHFFLKRSTRRNPALHKYMETETQTFTYNKDMKHTQCGWLCCSVSGQCPSQWCQQPSCQGGSLALRPPTDGSQTRGARGPKRECGHRPALCMCVCVCMCVCYIYRCYICIYIYVCVIYRCYICIYIYIYVIYI